MMKVGITTDYVDKTRTGIGNYTKSLVQGLLKNEESYDMDICAIHYEKNSDPLYSEIKEIIIHMLPIPPRKALTNLSKLPHQLKKEGIELVHITAPNPSDNLSIPFIKGVKKVMTIHDMGFALSSCPPKFFDAPNSWFLSKVWGSSLKKIVNKLDKIIAVSENTKRDIIRYTQIEEKKIRVIHEAPDERFEMIKDLKNDFVNSPFILHDSYIYENSIRAFGKLKERGIKHKLLIFGSIDICRNRAIYKLIENLGLRREIIMLGYISDENLVRLYNLADLFLFPSGRYEGFGLPPLEAMACGCPVVTPIIAPTVGPIPEVLGDASVMINLYNVDEWVNAIYEVLTNEGLKDDLIKRGLERVKKFSWEKAARETYKVYEEVCAQ
jgi:glycosyltransferase involved in cell wall biosynthesis